MVFASIREYASSAIFFASRVKKIALRAASSLESTDSRAASTSYIFRLQQSIWKSFSLK